MVGEGYYVTGGRVVVINRVLATIDCARHIREL